MKPKYFGIWAFLWALHDFAIIYIMLNSILIELLSIGNMAVYADSADVRPRFIVLLVLL